MSYVDNINKIDVQLKKSFQEVKINNSDHRVLDISLSDPVNENINSDLKMKLYVNQIGLNNTEPILEWGYYFDSNNPIDSAKFRSKINDFDIIINDVLINNRFSEEYLESITNEYNVELVVEDKDIEVEEGVLFNDIFEMKPGYMKIFGKKLQSYFLEKYGVLFDVVSCTHTEVTSGKVIGKNNIATRRSPKLGDECEIYVSGISSISYNGNISTTQWLSIEGELRKLPYVTDVYVSTYKYELSFTFSSDILVELY